MELLDFQPLIWLLLIPVIALGLRHSLVDRPVGLQWGSFLLRAAGIFLLVLALCRPYLFQPGDDVHVAFVVDVSESVKLDSARAALDEIQRAIDELRPRDSWTVFAVASELRRYEELDALRQVLDRWKETGLDDQRFRDASRLDQALLETRACFPAGKSRRVVLFSDGQQTGGDLTTALRRLREEQIDVRLNRIGGWTDPEAAVLAIRPSAPNAFRGEVVRFAVDVVGNTDMEAEVRIVHKGVVVLSRSAQLDRDTPRTVHFDVPMMTPGASVWSAELSTPRDRFPINNRASCTVSVRGKPRVLVLHDKPVRMRPWSRAMEEQGFVVDVRGKLGLPDSMEGLLAFDAIVLAELAATALSARQMNLLEKYVTDFGGGLAMLGSENSFGLGGYFQTPVEEVLPLTSRFEKEKQKPSLAIVLVIDKSGSMSGMPIALARQAARAVVQLLSARDQIAVIGFDSQPYIVSEMRSAMEADAVSAAIDSLAAGGGTFMYPAMAQGKEMLDATAAQIRHMIVLSDGQTQPADHESLVQEMADSRITVSTIALGQADRALLSRLAEIGGGRYYETSDPTNVPQIFTKETMQASRSAIKEDVFQTVQVGDHPILAGYGNTELPLTFGYVMTQPKPTAQLLLVTGTGDPLLAVSRYGLGTGLAYTSDLTERWGAQWLAWEGCGKFWAQTLRGIVRQPDVQGLRVAGSTGDELWQVRVERVDSAGRPVSGIAWAASVLSGDGVMEPVEVEQVGLGTYVVRVPVEGRRRLTLRLHDRDYDKLKVLHFHAPYPAEYRLGTALPEHLRNVPALPPEAVRAALPRQWRRRPAQHWAGLAALACLFGGILLRRI